MALSKELVIVILLGLSAAALGRIDVGKALGRAKVSLATNHGRNRLVEDIASRARGIQVSARLVPPAVNPRFKTRPIPEVIPEPVPEVTPEDIPNHSLRRDPTAVGATPCQTTAQWEGSASEWDHMVGNNNRFNITFDGLNHRKRIMEDKHAQLPGKRIYEYIMLFDQGIQYVINHNYNTCTVEKLGTWRNHSIPPNATLEDVQEIGPPGSGFLVEEWSDRIPGRQKESWIGTFSSEGCWPVTETFMEKDEHSEMIQSVSTRFFNLSRGIRSMSVFTPPAICNQARLQTTPPPLPRVPLKSNPIGSRIRPAMPRRLPSVPRTRPEMPRARPNLNRMPDVSRLPDQGRALLEAMISGDHRQIPEGMDQFNYETIAKMYRAVINSRSEG